MEDFYLSFDFLLSFLVEAERELEEDGSVDGMRMRYIGVFVFAFKAFYDVNDRVIDGIFKEIDRMDEVFYFLMWVWQRDLCRVKK